MATDRIAEYIASTGGDPTHLRTLLAQFNSRGTPPVVSVRDLGAAFVGALDVHLQAIRAAAPALEKK
jgi:hypothetical protein